MVAAWTTRGPWRRERTQSAESEAVAVAVAVAEAAVEAAAGLQAVGPHLAITDGAAAQALSALESVTEVEDALLVFVTSADGGIVLRDCLPHLVTAAGERGARRLVLAASGLGARQPASGRRPAEKIAADAGLTIIAPDGIVRVLDDGVLRVVGAAGGASGRTAASQGSWWSCPPGAPSSELGPEWPPRQRQQQQEQRPFMIAADAADAADAVAVPVPMPAPVPVSVSVPASVPGPPPPPLPQPHPCPAGWTVEPVATGTLWLRPADAAADPSPGLGHLSPQNPHDGPVLVVGAGAPPIPDDVWQCVPDLARAVADSADSSDNSSGSDGPRRVGLRVLAAESEQTAGIARVLCRLYDLEWLGFDAATEVPGPAPAPAPAPEPLPPPRPVQTATTAPPPAPTHAAVAPTPPAAPPLPSAPSSADDRAVLREALAAAYVRLAARTDQVITRLPVLRTAPRDEVRPELVAVLLHHTDASHPADRATLAGAARGSRTDPVTQAYLRCLGSGLRRLPSHQGVVILGAHAGAGAVAPHTPFTPGSVLHEPAAVTALPGEDAFLGTALELAVWSTTARRTHLFGAPNDEPEVVFPPGTSFRVLAVLEAADGEDGEDGVTRVLLREAARDEERPEELDDRALRRLRPAVERRAAIPAPELRRIARPQRVLLAPGIVP